jgi:hypothetical protein
MPTLRAGKTWKAEENCKLQVISGSLILQKVGETRTWLKVGETRTWLKIGDIIHLSKGDQIGCSETGEFSIT